MDPLIQELYNMLSEDSRAGFNLVQSRRSTVRRYIREVAGDTSTPLEVEGGFGNELLSRPLVDLYGVGTHVENGIRFGTPPRPQRIPEVPEDLSNYKELFNTIVSDKLRHSPGTNNTDHVNSDGVAYTFSDYSFEFLSNQLSLQLSRIDVNNAFLGDVIDISASTAVVCAARIIVPHGDLVLLEETITDVYRHVNDLLQGEYVYTSDIIFNVNKFTLLRRATVMSFQAAGGVTFNQPLWSESFHFCNLINTSHSINYQTFYDVATTVEGLEPGLNLFLTLN